MAVVVAGSPELADAPPRPGPAAASLRGYLREALPPLYRDRATIEPPAIERWVGALEEVLDPIVLQLDNLAAHLDPMLAELPWIDTLTSWVGMRVDLALPLEARRARVARANVLGPRRGTLAGLREALAVTFADLRFDATDNATVEIGRDPAERRLAPAPELFLTLPSGLDDERRNAVIRVVDDQLPAHVRWSLDAAPATSSGEHR